MKTKITSFLTLLAFSLLTFATGAFADAEESFYEKNHVRGFISVGADYRGMFSEFRKYVNSVAFINGYHIEEVEVEDEEGNIDTVSQYLYGDFKYDSFDDYYLGLHVNIGAQYKQFLTWLDVNFMPTQVSDRSSSTYKATSDDGTSNSYPLYDVKWFAYGVDWMFGWKLFGEDTFINLIPAVGFGFNLINFHLASNFDIVDEDDPSVYETVRDRYYSTMATTFNAELELRFEFGPIAVGAYGGYRYIRYNELNFEGMTIDKSTYDTDNVGDTYFFGVRVTWIFLSDWQKKQMNKL